MRQPVIANAFEKPCRKIVRSAMPGKRRDADVCALERELGINFVAQHQQILFDGRIPRSSQLRARARAARRIARQIQHEHFAPGCHAARSASAVSAKLSFAYVGTGDASPCTSVMLG